MPRTQPLERYVGGAGELGGRRARSGVRNHAPCHRQVGRTSQLHALGHVVAGRRVTPNSPERGLRRNNEQLPFERCHGKTGSRPVLKHVQTYLRYA